MAVQSVRLEEGSEKAAGVNGMRGPAGPVEPQGLWSQGAATISRHGGARGGTAPAGRELGRQRGEGG